MNEVNNEMIGNLKNDFNDEVFKKFPLVKIAAIITNGDLEVLSEIKKISEDSEGYFDEHEDILDEWFFTEDDTDEEELKLMLFITVLENHNYLCTRDWKDEKEDFVYFLQNLKEVKKNNLPIDEDLLDEKGHIGKWSAVLDEKWEPLGFCVGNLKPWPSDSYHLFLCKLQDLEELRNVADLEDIKIKLAKNM